MKSLQMVFVENMNENNNHNDINCEEIQQSIDIEAHQVISTSLPTVEAKKEHDDCSMPNNLSDYQKHIAGNDENYATGVTDEPAQAVEEVWLPPGTKRDTSDADDAAAGKRKPVEDSAAVAAVLNKDTEVESEVQNVAHSKPTEDVGDYNALEEDPFREDGTTPYDALPTEFLPQDNDNETEDDDDIEHGQKPENIKEINATHATCIQCNTEQPCSFRFPLKNYEYRYLCTESCVKAYLNPGRYTVTLKKYCINEIAPTKLTCSECKERKICYFYYDCDGRDTHYCSLNCVNSMMADESEMYVFKRRRIYVHTYDIFVEEKCFVCSETKQCNLVMCRYGEKLFVCGNSCVKTLNNKEFGRYSVRSDRISPAPWKPAAQPPQPRLSVNLSLLNLQVSSKVQENTPAMVQAARDERERTFIRTCNQCAAALKIDAKTLTWATMDFCDEVCLGRYQNTIGSTCANCKNAVPHTSLGKYCVRFGNDLKQFCKCGCLEEFKKDLKICCFCQKDISVGHQGFLAAVGNKGQFKDFCSQACMEKFNLMSKSPVPPPVWAKCAVCSLEKATSLEVQVSDDVSHRLCSFPCFAAFKFANNIFPDQCRWCKKHFERKQSKCFTIYADSSPQCFCSKSCMNLFISNSRHIVPCSWCKVKKYNFDMIRRLQPNGQPIMMCSLNCLNLHKVYVNAASSKLKVCEMCSKTSLAQYHLTMSDATVFNFCSYTCTMSFKEQYSGSGQVPALVPGETVAEPAAVPTGPPTRIYNIIANNNINATSRSDQCTPGVMPVICYVQSLAVPPPLIPAMPTVQFSQLMSPKATPLSPLPQTDPPKAPETELPPAPATPSPPPKTPTSPPAPTPEIYNYLVAKTLPPTEDANKRTMAKPMPVSKGDSSRPHMATKECQTDPSLDPRALIPVPVPIYVPVPCAMWSLPFPIPIPIPLPVPTPVFIPTTKNTAKGILKEIEKINEKTPIDPIEAELLLMAEMVAGDKKKDQSDSEAEEEKQETISPAADIDKKDVEDMPLMALKMATEYQDHDQPVDLESVMTANTIAPSSHPGLPAPGAPRKRARAGAVATPVPAVRPVRASKRRRADPTPPPQPDPPCEPAEKPDANMCLMYTFGVNAWKQWVMTKNAEIEKSSIRRKPFKSEILQLTADELNYSLCLFVKEVRKPNGSEYAPDTIYYLVLGIQKYLLTNGRIDNIFMDPYYEKFTDCFDEIARKFSALHDVSQCAVTRVVEEHLWDSKQLGALSPHVLLFTLVFFNTKHFNLTTVDEHLQLSFSHIMKHWKKKSNKSSQAKTPGCGISMLKFYPPQSALQTNPTKNKLYEQPENVKNPLRCPVKLFEFYISKCVESVRTRNDVFYLQPERSCVPDSPVWYSTQALSRAALANMLHRVKMVKEINIALLTS